MNRAAVPIPEKLFFKIGEVCDITGIQAHVLRYWESEFPTLAPQKNRAGQRTYRKRDVEMVLRIKELLYDDQYTIAGAKKKLTSDLRGASKLKVVTPEMAQAAAQPSQQTSQQEPATSLQSFDGGMQVTHPLTTASAPAAFVNSDNDADGASLYPSASMSLPSSGEQLSDEQRIALRRLKDQLREIVKALDARV